MTLSGFFRILQTSMDKKIGLVALCLLFPHIRGASSDYAFANMSLAVTPFDSLISDASPFALERRQQRVCEIPGGPICDAIHCCEPGYNCCPTGCCPTTSNCFGTGRCCPKVNTDCGGLACCPPGMSCCGSTCCTSGETCERNECIDKNLKDKVIRLAPNGKNKELLVNMCNGLRGKNTETLTYRGPDLNERGRTRRAAGCVDGFCANQIRLGLVPSTHNSCDEYPPASSVEGGNTRPQLERAINCIPGPQNSHQGWVFSDYQKQLRKLGASFNKGDKFVISIDCDKVLGPKLRPDDKRDVELIRRDGETITQSGNGTVDSTLVSAENPNFKYILLPLGDLSTGTYSTHIQILSGSTFGGYVIDEDGDHNYTANDAGLTTGQTQDYAFTLDVEAPGLTLVIATTDNDTTISWKLDGTITNLTTSSSTGSPNPTSSGSSSDAQHSGIAVGMIGTMAAIGFLAWILQ